MVLGCSGFLKVAVWSQLSEYSPRVQVLLGLRTSVHPPCLNTRLLYTLAHSLDNFLISPKCHLGEITVATPSL